LTQQEAVSAALDALDRWARVYSHESTRKALIDAEHALAEAAKRVREACPQLSRK
jgi:hypothetical protein